MFEELKGKIGIYKITSPSNRIYIGQSVNIYNRWKSYFNNSASNAGQKLLNNSFVKYGIENHIFEVVEECEKKYLNSRERYWQDFYDVLNGGLNLMLQEAGEKQRVLSKETLERKRLASLGEKNGMYGRSGELNPNFGKNMSEEDRQKLSEKMKGKYDGENNPFYGKKHKKESLEKMSNLASKRTGDKNSFYGKKHTEEYKKQSSENKKKFFKENPNIVLQMKISKCVGVYYTPKGEFISQRDAAEANGVSRTSIKNRCIVNCDKKVGYNNQIPEEFRGEKTWREIGWFL